MTELPGQLRQVVARATAVDPSHRYESATLLLADLRSALESCGVPALERSEIGRYALELFADDRAKLQASINDALQRYGTIRSFSEPSGDCFIEEPTVHGEETVDLSGDAGLLMSLEPSRLSARPSRLHAAGDD